MDLQSKIKEILSEREPRENKRVGSVFESSGISDKRYKEVTWFSQSSKEKLQALDSCRYSYNRRDSNAANILSNPQKKSEYDLLNLLEKAEIEQNTDLKHRCTKLVCTLGNNTKHVDPLIKMIQKGMDVARLNMNYFELHEQVEAVTNIRQACQIANKEVAIMVDLKGPLIRTLGFKSMYSIKVTPNQEIRLSTNQLLKGDEGMFVIDYPNIHQKVKIGDKILIDYGGVVLTVIGFENESKYLKQQEKKHQSLSSGATPQSSPSKDFKMSLTHCYKDDQDIGINSEIRENLEEEDKEDEEDDEYIDIINDQNKVFQNLTRLESENKIRMNQQEVELEQDKTIYYQVLKKGASNALAMAKKAERANRKISSNFEMQKTTSTPLPFSAQAQLDSQLHPSTFQDYKIQRNESGADLHQDIYHIHFDNLEYLQKKRFSQGEKMKMPRLFQMKHKKALMKRCESPLTKAIRSHHSQATSDGDSVQGDKTQAHGTTEDINSPFRDQYDDEPILEKIKMLVVCRAENEGEIKENKPIYIPGLDWHRDLKLSVLGDNDIKVLQKAIQQSVHMIAVSCVEKGDDISFVKKVLGLKGQHIRVLAKLQSKKSLENFHEILAVADGIVIARGYLGLSLDMEDVVYVQKYIIKQCNMVGKPVLLSTQIMESMVKNKQPTRAEVVDITNAVFEGIDSIILSPETAIGENYELATEAMSNICFQAEKHLNYRKRWMDQSRLLKNYIYKSMENDKYQLPEKFWLTEETISSCAVKASFDVKASLIIVFTHSGITCRKVAKYKPKCPVLAVTPNEWAAKSILINRGCFSMLVGSLSIYETLLKKVLEEAQARKLVEPGDFIVVTSGLSGSVGSTNLLKIFKV